MGERYLPILHPKGHTKIFESIYDTRNSPATFTGDNPARSRYSRIATCQNGGECHCKCFPNFTPSTTDFNIDSRRASTKHIYDGKTRLLCTNCELLRFYLGRSILACHLGEIYPTPL